jgi:photosystem II stability/assembly factor-like uncharacterized protein
MSRLGCTRRGVLASFLGIRWVAGACAFEDPLQMPAPAVRLGSQAPLAAVARAGARLVAAGARGLVIVSDDEGATWRQVSVPLSSDLTALYFVDENRGWCAGHDGVLLRTGDGGLNWRKQLDGNTVELRLRTHFEQLAARADPRAAALSTQLAIDHANGPEQPFLDVAFDTAQRGFASGAFGLLLGSGDGGASWQSWIERIDNPKALHLNALHRAGQAWLIASEQGTVFRLEDGAQHFVAVATGCAGSLFALAGDVQRVVACGLLGAVLESVDAGRSWRALASGVSAGLTAGTALEDGRVALVSQSGQLIVSHRGERSFEAPRTVASLPLAGVVQGGDGLVAVGPGGVQRVPLA